MKMMFLSLLLLCQAAAFGKVNNTVMPYTQAELKWRLDKFSSPSYRAKFVTDLNSVARLRASKGIHHYEDIMQNYPDIKASVTGNRAQQISKGVPANKKNKPGIAANLKNKPTAAASRTNKPAVAGNLIPAYSEAELKWRLDRFVSPSYRAKFMNDSNSVARLRASKGVKYYDDIAQNYPDLMLSN